MKLGGLEIKGRVFLAPMAGVTDAPFRTMCKERGCAFMYTEMVSAKGILYNNQNTLEMLPHPAIQCASLAERPIAAQLFGSSPEVLAEAARRLADLPVDALDINMGCPAPKIVKNGEGAWLMTDPGLVGRIVRAVSDASRLPVTVKIRKGFDAARVNAVEIAETAEANGAAAVAVHGRTRAQFYGGAADWDIIRRVKERVRIPVIGNGDVDSPRSAQQMLMETGCDAVMIGRASQGNPWIFNMCEHYLAGGAELPGPDMRERVNTALLHGQRLIAYKGERIGVLEMRKHLSWYMRGAPGAALLRTRINCAGTLDEMAELIMPLNNIFLQND
ncbi:MAG: tRNA dihydrouridine synthase DusB [Clostridiales bacterium]|jgi:nifR3 family TIM-barrel protein|nr:tRNA dihydrouridine synthase DusB [Clostridiales bacterium]